MDLNRTSKELLITAPSFIWLFIFFLIPSLIIFAYAFKPYTIYGDIAEGWTFQTIVDLFNSNLLTILWRTFWLSTLSTFICLMLALPMAYYLATVEKKWKNILLLLIVIPFWSSFLIRIFAWKTLLHPEGLLQRSLAAVGLISEDTTLLYHSSTVLFVMVYTYLPFAVLPIFAAASKFNFQLIEAAIDLGASRLQAFLKVFIPGIRKGIVTAILMVFIPAAGTYIIPDLVGGTNSEMLGNKIAQKTFIERSLPQASALSAFLALSIFIPVVLIQSYASRKKRIEAEAEKSRMRKSSFCKSITIAVLVVLYLPIMLLIINSFNESRFGGVWTGFSFKWYARLLEEKSMWVALQNSLIVAFTSTIVSTILGTCAAFALHGYRTPLQRGHYFLVYTPLVIPDILMGISLLLLFFAVNIKLGLLTITIAHTTFCVSYVAMVMLAKLQNFDFSVVEAAQDLGATRMTVIRRILLPLLAPAIISGALLAFTLSIDDFVITFFLAGEGVITLPLYIYSKVKFGSTPVINSLSTLILALTFLAIWCVQTFSKEETQ